MMNNDERRRQGDEEMLEDEGRRGEEESKGMVRLEANSRKSAERMESFMFKCRATTRIC